MIYDPHFLAACRKKRDALRSPSAPTCKVCRGAACTNRLGYNLCANCAKLTDRLDARDLESA